MIATIVILLLIFGYCGWVLRYMYKRKKAGICSCSGCSGCSCGCSSGSCGSDSGFCTDLSNGGK